MVSIVSKDFHFNKELKKSLAGATVLGIFHKKVHWVIKEMEKY